MLFTDQPAGRAIIVHDAGRISVNAHLLFEAAARSRVALSQRTILVDDKFRHNKERDAFDPFRTAFNAGQDKVNNVLGQILLTARDPDLLAGNFVRPIRLRHRLGLDQAEIGSALRFGQVHGASPFAGRHFRTILGSLFVRTTGHQGFERARSQPRIHRKCHIRRRRHFAGRHIDDVR